MQEQAQQLAPTRRELWPIPEFCRAHGVSKTTAYDLLAAGKLAAVKIGRRSYITAESRNAWRASLPEFRSDAAQVAAA